MHTLTGRSIRPCLQPGRSSFSIAPTRRTTFPPLHKPFSHGDAFLVLLPGVLATALVINITGKDRKRAEWDRQIAIAQEEAEQLRQRQLEAWSRIQRRSVSHGAWQQRRSLWTASQSVQPAREQADQFLDEEREQEMDPLDKEAELNTADTGAAPLVDQTTEEYQHRHQRFGRLLATRLALQLMLQLRSGRSKHYQPPATIDTKNTTFKQSMDYIVHELDHVLLLMHSVRIREVPWDITMPPEYLEQQAEMGRRIAEISRQYSEAEIHLPDYILCFVQLVTEFKIAPSLRSYVLMMRTLNHNQQESPMANYVEKAIFDCHEYLDSYTISNVIYRYGKNLDSVRMNEFLERITRADHHPQARSVWYRTHVNDIDVCIPKSKDGHLMTGLIRAALTNRQQTVAEAYATVFMDRDRVERYSSVHKWFVLGNFLNAYGKWGSWKSGKRWLETAVLWTSELAQARNFVLGRVILRMLDFCVACEQREDYELIMGAAIAANISIPPIDPTRLIGISDRMGQIRMDWIKRTESTREYTKFRHQDITKDQIQIFQSALQGRYDPKQEHQSLPFHPSDSDWTDSAVVGWNPLTAARRLAEVSSQRQGSVNTGFKNFAAKRSIFPPAGPQNSLSQEPRDIEADSNADTLGFASPFFQPIHNEAASSTTAAMNGTPAADSSSSEVKKLQDELVDAKQRLQEFQEKQQSETMRLKRDLKEARERIRRLQSLSTPPRSFHDEQDDAKQSAVGSG